jgi:hypothetical protein
VSVSGARSQDGVGLVRDHAVGEVLNNCVGYVWGRLGPGGSGELERVGRLLPPGLPGVRGQVHSNAQLGPQPAGGVEFVTMRVKD